MKTSSFRRGILKFGGEAAFVVEMCLSLLESTQLWPDYRARKKNTAVTVSIKAFETSSYLLLLLWVRSRLSPPEPQERGSL